ncbi:MAG: hypothetical protein KDI36_19185, partial [Pseudomonadales bacterium]|nr:hypothetical protein [Pseudomonadales bacterium]
MWLRLKQIACVAQQLAPVEQEICDILGLKVCYRDPGVSHFGLENALFPIGNQLLEVVAPTREGTAGGRYLARRGGDGGYMVITQCDDHPSRRARVDGLGVRIVLDHQSDEFINMQLHPQDTGGSFFEIDQQLGEGADNIDGPWHPAGPDWQAYRDTSRVTGIVAAEIQCDNPYKVAARWAEIATLPVKAGEYGAGIELENATLRFVSCTDGRPEGLGGIDVTCHDPEAVMEAARLQDRVTGESQIYVCGMRINLLRKSTR